MSEPETERKVPESYLVRHGREWLLPGEAEVLLRRRSIMDNVIAFILYFLVLYYFLRGVGVKLSPEVIIAVLRGVSVTLPKYIQAILPYVYHFYTYYMIVSATALLFLSQKRAFLPEWVYVLDATIHMQCGYLCYIYTHDLGYLILFFGVFGLGQLGLYLIYYRHVKREYVVTAVEGVKLGVRPRLSYEEARQLGLDEDTIRQLGILPPPQRQSTELGSEKESRERSRSRRVEDLLRSLVELAVRR